MTKFNKTWLLVLGLVILTALLLVISLSPRESKIPSASRKVNTNFAHTSLSISEDVRASTTSGIWEVDVNIDSGDNLVTGVQLELSFDPQVLTKVDVRPGDFIPNPVEILKRIDTPSGRISYILGGQLGKKGIKGKGTVATVSFSTTGGQQTQLNFLPQTIVAADGYDQSVLRQTVSAVIETPKTP